MSLFVYVGILPCFRGVIPHLAGFVLLSGHSNGLKAFSIILIKNKRLQVEKETTNTTTKTISSKQKKTKQNPTNQTNKRQQQKLHQQQQTTTTSTTKKHPTIQTNKQTNKQTTTTKTTHQAESGAWQASKMPFPRAYLFQGTG